MSTATEARPSRPLQPHGTTARAHGRPWAGVPACDCDPCLDARRRYSRNRTKLRQYGQPGRLPARVAAEHVRTLLAAGMPWNEVLAATGVSRGAMANLMKDGARVTITTHMRVIAVPIPADRRPSAQHMDGTGVRRRMQALARAGWSNVALAGFLGVSPSRIPQLVTAEQVTFATFERVVALYRRLEGTEGPCAAAARRAERRGWARPVDWDALDIDDPCARPGDSGRMPRPLEVAENVEFIRRTTGVADRDLIAARLGMTRDALDRNLDRAAAMRRRDPGADDAPFGPS